MNCKNSKITGKDRFNRDVIVCKITNNICPLVRFCPTKKNIISIENHTNCKYYKEKVGINIVGNKVLFEKKGFLFVELNDKIGQVVQVKNPFNTLPLSVILVKYKEVYYVKGYEPKEKEYSSIRKKENDNKKG